MLPVKRTRALADHNCPHIADALLCQLNRDIRNLLLLEIGSETGQHAGYLAPLFRNIIFQTSDVDAVNLTSLKAYADDCKTKNIRQPILIDVTIHPRNWKTKFKPNSLDYMLNINMVHDTPIDATIGLFQAAGFLLKLKGKLFTYGPYAEKGEITPHSAVKFNESLKTRNPEWGFRDIGTMERLAKQNGLKLTKNYDMPVNNKMLTWTKV